MNGLQITHLLNDHLTAIIKKFQNLPSIMKSKSKYNFQEKFSIKPVPVKYVESIIKNIPNNKAAGGKIPLHFLKQCGFTYQMLTDCIIDALSQGIFPDSLTFANITPVHKKTEQLTNKIIGHCVCNLYFKKSLKK